jgi:hypothetical protein
MTKERIQKQLKKTRQRNYLARDFDAFRGQLLRYARAYFPDKIRDFSESSVGGLFLDMNAFVGDNLSFYLDHQFKELNPATATEVANIESHIRNAGIQITGASPAVAEVTLLVEVFAIVDSNGQRVPDRSLLPVVREGSIFRSSNGINFNLVEDVDFGEEDENGELIATVISAQPSSTTSNGTFILARTTTCISGGVKTETFNIPNSFQAFRTINLAQPNVTDIISVRDSDGNKYYEVESLTQDNVFETGPISYEEGISTLELVPAPYRFIRETSLRTRKTKIRFGSGNADSLDDDIIPDPSEVSLPLFGQSNFGRVSIDPNSLLETQTLGISPKGTTITVKYRYGGGPNHNVSSRSIRAIRTAIRDFPRAASFDGTKHALLPVNDFNSLSRRIAGSLDVTNESEAVGGASAPSLRDLQSRVSSSRFLQARIVSKQDLLARIYSLPAKFGRVYRASIITNPDNPSGSPLVYIISRNSAGRLVTSSDLLKRNMSLYLNEFRLISDSMDILDARVVNFQIRYKVLISPNENKPSVLKSINKAVATSLKTSNFQIGQPILEDDVRNIIINQEGVISLVELEFKNVLTNEAGTFAGRVYSVNNWNLEENKVNGAYVPPIGGIFELRYPNSDILGSSV